MARLLGKEIESYGLIYVTSRGEEFLSAPWKIELVEDREFADKDSAEDADAEDAVTEKAASRGSGGAAHFYSIVTQDSKEQEFAMNRQLFLTEQGYAYKIIKRGDWDILMRSPEELAARP